jgi:hypothetical protein
LEDQAQRGVRTPDGSTYRVSGRFIYPRVVRTAPDGATTTVVAPPTPLAVLAGPMPAWGIAVLGGLIVGLSNQWARSRKGGDAGASGPG